MKASSLDRTLAVILTGHTYGIRASNNLGKYRIEFLPSIQPDALSISFFSGKIYAALGSKNAPTGAASLKRSAKKRAAIRARASKRASY